MSLFRPAVFERRRERLYGDIVITQPLSTNIYVAAIVGIVVMAAVWVSVSSYSRIETAPGILVTSIPSAKVIPLQAGIVTELKIHEGQLVKKGDQLMVVNSDRVAPDGAPVVASSLEALMGQRALNEAQVAMTANKARSEIARLRNIITSAQQRQQNLTQKIQLQEQIVESNSTLFTQLTPIVERGFVSKGELERRRQNLLISQQSLADLQQQLINTKSEAQQAREQLVTVSIDAQQGISRIQEGLHVLSAEQARVQGDLSYVVTAPIAGRISALSVGVGRVVTSARPVLIIVPEQAELFAELYAPTRAIGFVEPGDETRLLYDAFPYQKFGSFGGSVESIAKIAVDTRESDIPFDFQEPIYRIKVRLDRQTITANGVDSQLQPGMTLKANIVLDRQTFLGWLLQPLNAVLNRTA